ncbi:MAG: hypothetical protein ACI9MR_003285 [Myxococcota bacterium]|jgi:hypothetical protein
MLKFGKLARLTMFLATAALAGACGDDTGGGKDTGLDTFFDTVDVPDGTNDSDTSNPDAVKRLEFDEAFGDDQRPCRGTDRCSISISFNSDRTLEVRYTEDGQPVAGQVVKFSLDSDPDGIGFINTLSSVTNEQGIATVLTKSQESRIGQFAVKAFIDKSEIPPLFFDVVVTPKGQVPLTVVGEYSGSRLVGTYNVLLFRQDAANAPDCSDMAGLFDKTASQAKDSVLLTASAQFPEFDNLETDMTQNYTIFVYSKNENDAVQAWGCNDMDGTVSFVTPTTVVVQMLDRPPIYAGAYGITSLFDFVSAIPEPYRMWVEFVVGFFQSPSEAILELTCQLINPEAGDGQQLDSFCNLIFNDDFTLTALGGFASDLIDAIITSISEGSIFGQVFQVGGDVADVLKAFEMKATLTFNNEPDAAGEWALGEGTGNWHSVRVKWSLGADCDPVTDVGCGDRLFSSNQFQQEPITGIFSARVTNVFDLTVDPHSLNLRYGALVNYFLEAFLLPLVTGEPVVNTYEELLQFFVGGGVACLTPTVDGLSCCQTFADNDASNGSGLSIGNGNGQIDGNTENIVSNACQVIVTTAPGFLRNALTNLDVGTASGFQIGTKRVCPMVDVDDDLIIDGLGSPANPCLWDVRIGDSTTIDSQFWGARL